MFEDWFVSSLWMILAVFVFMVIFNLILVNF